MMIRLENTGKIAMEGKFTCAVYRKDVGISSILCQFSRSCVHNSSSGIRGKLEGNR